LISAGRETANRSEAPHRLAGACRSGKLYRELYRELSPEEAKSDKVRDKVPENGAVQPGSAGIFPAILMALCGLEAGHFLNAVARRLEAARPNLA
jgi:hypothetical protein